MWLWVFFGERAGLTGCLWSCRFMAASKVLGEETAAGTAAGKGEEVIGAEGEVGEKILR